MNSFELYKKSPEAEELLKGVPLRLRIITLISFIAIASTLFTFLFFLKFPVFSKKEVYAQIIKKRGDTVALILINKQFVKQKNQNLVELEFKDYQGNNIIAIKKVCSIIADTILLRNFNEITPELKTGQLVFVTLVYKDGEKNIFQKIFW